MPKLTDRFLAGFKVAPGRKDRLVFDISCPGLGVRATTRGTKSFIVQWTDPATKRKVREPLGVWGSLTIEQAREAARVRLGQVAKGVNPRTERLRVRAESERERAETALTFDALVTEWETLHLVHRRPRYAAEAARAIRQGLTSLLKRPAARITKGEAVNALDALVQGGKAVTAGRTMAYARAAFAWAERRGKVPVNPFKRLPVSASATERDRVLSDAELWDAWSAAGGMGYPWAPFFQLTMLTLQRREEVAGMRWSEIADDLAMWHLPAERMKNGKPHDVHLSKAARAVLQVLPKVSGCDFVFTTTGRTPISGFSGAKATLDASILKARAASAAKIGATAAPLIPWRLHDLRRTGVSTLARLGFDNIVVDMLLAHQPAKLRGAARVYQRHNFAVERARALDVWASHVDGSNCDNVVPILMRTAS
jgi:integrase